MKSIILTPAKCTTNTKCNTTDAKCNKIDAKRKEKKLTQNAVRWLPQNIIHVLIRIRADGRKLFYPLY